MPKALKDASVMAVSMHRSELVGIAAQRARQEAEDDLFIESLPAVQRKAFQRAAALGAATRPAEPLLSMAPLLPAGTSLEESVTAIRGWNGRCRRSEAL